VAGSIPALSFPITLEGRVQDLPLQMNVVAGFIPTLLFFSMAFSVIMAGEQ
jgi:hypothetical protein